MLIFVYPESIGHMILCKEMCLDRSLVREIYESNQVSGISMILIKSYDDALSKFVLSIDRIIKNIGNKYPFFIISVSPFKEYQSNIRNYLQSFNYTEIPY